MKVCFILCFFSWIDICIFVHGCFVFLKFILLMKVNHLKTGIYYSKYSTNILILHLKINRHFISVDLKECDLIAQQLTSSQ